MPRAAVSNIGVQNRSAYMRPNYVFLVLAAPSCAMLLRLPRIINSSVPVHSMARQHSRPHANNATHHARLAFCIRVIERRGYDGNPGLALTYANIYSIAYADGGTLTIGVPTKDRDRAIKIVRADSIKHGYTFNILPKNATNRSGP